MLFFYFVVCCALLACLLAYLICCTHSFSVYGSSCILSSIHNKTRTSSDSVDVRVCVCVCVCDWLTSRFVYFLWFIHSDFDSMWLVMSFSSSLCCHTPRGWVRIWFSHHHIDRRIIDWRIYVCSSLCIDWGTTHNRHTHIHRSTQVVSVEYRQFV